MAERKKSRKHGRSKRNGQALRYKNEHKREQNKLRRLQAHIARNGMTGNDAREATRKCEIILFGVPKTDTPVKARRHRSPELEAKSKQMRRDGVMPKGTFRAA